MSIEEDFAQLRNRLFIARWGLEGVEGNTPAAGMAGSGVPAAWEGRDSMGSLPWGAGGPLAKHLAKAEGL